MKYLWVASENPSLSLLLVCKGSICYRPQAGHAPLVFHQDLETLLTCSMFASLLFASLQSRVQNAIVGNWGWCLLKNALRWAGLSINWSLPKKRPLGIAIGTAELPPAQLKMSKSLDHNLNKITSTKILASLQRRFKLFLSSSAIWLSFEVKRKEGLGAFLFKKKKKPSPLWKYFS